MWQNLAPDVMQLIEQLERHCLAPDGSLVSKSAFVDLRLVRDEMCRERLKYLEAMAIYAEAIAMLEEYQQANAVGNLGGIRDVRGMYPQHGLKSSPQCASEVPFGRIPSTPLVVAEASQKLRLPLILKDGEIHEEEIEKWSTLSRSSLDRASTFLTMSSSSNSTSYANSMPSAANISFNDSDQADPGVGGVPNPYLGITPGYLLQTQLQHAPFLPGMDVGLVKLRAI